MLCEYVWKDQQVGDKKKKESDDDNAFAGEEATPNETHEEGEEDKKQETYDDYRQEYCLNYVRTFFNEHIDIPGSARRILHWKRNVPWRKNSNVLQKKRLPFLNK
jgi:hypothetical protein